MQATGNEDHGGNGGNPAALPPDPAAMQNQIKELQAQLRNQQAQQQLVQEQQLRQQAMTDAERNGAMLSAQLP